jgi:hypothetical protein
VLITAFLCCCSITTRAQITCGGFFPEGVLTKQINEKYFARIKIESQHGLFGETPRRKEDKNYFYYRTDLQGFIGAQLAQNIKMAVGYQYRFDPKGTHHRTIQQIAFQPDNKRWQHRVRSDQTFEKQQPITWRIRYRMRYRKNISNSNAYLVLSNEILYAYQQTKMAWENRFVVGLGQKLKDGNRIEIGPDYRVDAVLGGELRTRWWLKVGWFQTF